jgi:hypothetical protein
MGTRTKPAGSPRGKDLAGFPAGTELAGPSRAELDARIRAFAGELEDLIRRATEEGIRAAISGALASGRLVRPGEVLATVAKGNAGKPVRVKAEKPKADKAVKPKQRKKGQKRSPEELAALEAKLEAFIQENGGKRIEEIGKELGITTSELAGPVKKLLDAARIRSTGERRATRYYASKKK